MRRPMRRNLLLLLVITLAFSGFPSQGGAQALPPVGQVSIEMTGLAAGVGFTWGRGVLWFKGKKYRFGIEGLSVGDVGYAKVGATGGVYKLGELKDFSGTYVAVGAGVALAGGMAGLTMRNEHGVIIDLYATQEGVKLNLGPQGLTINLR
ncbi:MAG: DUF1134 domain-containing protein [Thermodesulfobacteriota bacterium]